MTVYGYTLLDSAGAHCPDVCVSPMDGFTRLAYLLSNAEQ